MAITVQLVVIDVDGTGIPGRTRLLTDVQMLIVESSAIHIIINGKEQETIPVEPPSSVAIKLVVG